MAKPNYAREYYSADPDTVAHPERLEAALERVHQAVRDVRHDQMPRVSIRLDDLQQLLDHIEALTAEFELAQRCVLEQVCETIEFIGERGAGLGWQSLVAMIRENLPPRPEDRPIAKPPPKPRRKRGRPRKRPTA